jgi:hypothetical protein
VPVPLEPGDPAAQLLERVADRKHSLGSPIRVHRQPKRSSNASFRFSNDQDSRAPEKRHAPASGWPRPRNACHGSDRIDQSSR